MAKRESLNVLYVEDDASDVEIVTAVLPRIDGRITVAVVADGEGALDYLRQKDKFRKAVLPDLVLLDLNLPKMDGREVLRAIKSLGTGTVPVVVFSTSNAQRDIDLAYRLGAAAYLVKPMELLEYQRTFQALCDFWEKRVDFPSKERPG